MKVMTVREDKPPVGKHQVPDEVAILDDDDCTELRSGGEHFITAYVPECVFGPAPA
jgi:hypothetical protein